MSPPSLKLPPCPRYQERRDERERLRAPGLQEQEKEPDNCEGKEETREGAGKEGYEGRRMSHSFSEAALHDPVATVKKSLLNCASSTFSQNYKVQPATRALLLAPA